MPSTLNIATAFPIPPEPDETESLEAEFLTDIVAAANGRESRAALRHVPVRRYSYTARFATAADALRFRALWLSATEKLRYIVPLWQRAAMPTSIAGTTIAGDFRYRGFTPGVKAAFLWRSETQWELVDIDTVADDSIALLNAVVGDYAIGSTLLIPALVAWLDPPDVELKGVEAEQVALVFREELRRVSGTDASVGVDVTPVVSSVDVVRVNSGSEWVGEKFHTWEAIVRDASGAVVPDLPISWLIVQSVSLDHVRTLLPYGGRQLHIAFSGGTGTYYAINAVVGGVTSPTVAG